MADVRCPMCGKPNDEHAELCEFCGARLTPLKTRPIEESGDQDSPESGGEVVSTGDTDWLSTIRSQVADQGGEDPGQGPPDAEESSETSSVPDDEEQDWLGRLDEVSPATSTDEPLQESGPPGDQNLEAEAPADTSDAPEAEPVGAPDWLSDLREEAQEPQAEPEEEFPEWLGDTSDLLAAAADQDQSEASGESIQGEAGEIQEGESSPDWLSEMPEATLAGPEGPPEGDIPEWLSDAEQDTPRASSEEDAVPDLPDEAEEGEVPGWLSRIREKEGDEVGDGQAVSPGEQKQDPAGEPLGEPTFDETVTELPSTAESIPEEGIDQDSPLIPDTDLDSGWFRALDSPDAVVSDVDRVSAEPEIPELDGDGEADGEAAEAEPAADLPHVPALIVDSDGEEPGAQTEDLDFDAIQLPDWLAESQGPVQTGAADETAGREDRSDLAPATLPNWLESMRPVETLQPVIELEPEEDQTVESVGPLAGLKGILSAEPVVAKPRASTMGATRLEVTERQYAQAELMRRMVEDEQREFTTKEKAERSLPAVRWAISLALLIAVALPVVLGIPAFPLPTRVPRDLGPLIELVNGLPVEQPALVVFDYEPGYAGELDAVSAPYIDQLMSRGIGIVTLSTRPTGPPLANQLVTEVGSVYDVENGRNYINLGYLSGGPTAIQVFAASPRDSVLQGFAVPDDLEVNSVWETPLLAGVSRLSDFSSITVITADSDNAREWVEQAEPWMGESELIMVLSTGTEPMVRPYFESLEPQVNAILTGLPAAVAYEQVNGRVIFARDLWDSYAAGILAIEIILVLGLVYGITNVGLKYRRS